MDLVESLLPPVTDENPCGPFVDDDDDLESEFMLLENACRSKQSQFDEDDGVEAEATDWRDAVAKAESLAEKTKDVRVLVYLAKSLLNTKGFTGLANSVHLLSKILEGYWKDVHPILDDASDDNPWRMMCLNELGGEELLASLHAQPIVKARMAGSFTLRDIKLAKGLIVPVAGSEQRVPDLALVAGAFQEVGAEGVATELNAVESIIADLKAIETQLQQSECSHVVMGWGDLNKTLEAILNVFKDYGCMPVAVEPQPQVTEDAAVAQSDSAATVAVSSSAPAAVSVPAGSIASRDDVLKMLHKINEYYAKFEPSSPLPLLINRAIRLVPMDFMSILRDITPDGIHQAELLVGKVDEPQANYSAAPSAAPVAAPASESASAAPSSKSDW